MNIRIGLVLSLLTSVIPLLAADFTQSVTVTSNSTTQFAFTGLDVLSGRGDNQYLLTYEWFVDDFTNNEPEGAVLTVLRTLDNAILYSPFSSGPDNIVDPVGYASFLTTNGNYAKPFILGNNIIIHMTQPPKHGLLTFVPGTNSPTINAAFTADFAYVGDDNATFVYSNGSVLFSGILKINVANLPPRVSLVIPNTAPVLIGGSVTFYANGSDPDHNPIVYLWDFGDGTSSAEQNPSHQFSTAGTYTVMCTVTDTGGLTSSASDVIQIFSPDDQPLASFVTSAVNATQGQPLGFDATFTTDPANVISEYFWDFGDGTPTGAGVVISHIFKSIGTYTTTLTAVDSHGLMNSTSATIVVVGAANGPATPLLIYTARFSTKKANADSLEVTAQLNPGVPVTENTQLGVTIAGSQFRGTTGSAVPMLANKTHVKWTAKQVRKAPGVVLLKAIIRGASLIGFPSTSGKFTVPVKLSVGPNVFSAPVTNTFRFGLSGGVAASK